MLKYTLSQYVHDGFRLRLIEQEKAEIRSYGGVYEWTRLRMGELLTEELSLHERMARFEKHPNNR